MNKYHLKLRVTELKEDVSEMQAELQERIAQLQTKCTHDHVKRLTKHDDYFSDAKVCTHCGKVVLHAHPHWYTWGAVTTETNSFTEWEAHRI